MAKKKASFLTKATNFITATTPEQRARAKADNLKIKMAEAQAYKQERLKQATKIGQAKARIQARQKIKAMTPQKSSGGEPKDLFSARMGAINKVANFDSGLGLTSTASKNVPSVNDIANMSFMKSTKKRKKK